MKTLWFYTSDMPYFFEVEVNFIIHSVQNIFKNQLT